MNKMTGKRSSVLRVLSVLSLSLCLEPASAATPVNCGDNLKAPGPYILTGNLSCSGTAVTITASDVHFDLAGFTINGDGTGTGIEVGGAACTATSGVRINGGTITGFTGGFAIPNPNAGIRLCNASNAKVNGMTLTQNGAGIALTDSDTNKISANTVTSNVFQGMLMLGSDNNSITANTFTGNGSGLFMDDSHGNKVTANTANGNQFDGIDLDARSSNNRITGNTANNNDEGIDVQSESNDNIIKGNTTNDNESGIRLGAVEGNLIQGNTSLGNSNTFDDMRDEELPTTCDDTWTSNTFVSDNEGDGPGAGCIQ